MRNRSASRSGSRAVPAHVGRYLVAFLLAACLQGALLSVALAHAELVRSDPADNATLAHAPAAVRLWFSEAIAPGFTGARVLSQHGVRMPGVRAHADPSDNTLLVLDLRALPDGVYSVAFTALSAADGHTTQGHIAFKVGSGPALAAAEAGPSVAWPDALLHWLDFVAQAGLIGSLTVAFMLLERGARTDAAGPTGAALAQAQRRVLAWGAACGLLALIVGDVAFFRQASQLAESMPGSQAAPIGPIARQLLVTTRAGQLWLGRQVVLIVMAADLLVLWLMGAPARRRARRGAGVILAVLAVGLIAATTLSGHATALDAPTTPAVVIDWAHLLAASLWVGGLLALAVGVLPLLLQRRGTPGFAALAHAAWGPFGAMAALSVATLFATGLYNTGREVASPDALLTSLYGRTLIAKVGVVLLVGAIGLLNSMLLHPAVAAPVGRVLRKPAAWRPLPLNRLPALVLGELGLGFVVLLLTGILTSTTPPHGPAYEPQYAQPGAAAQTQTADDLQILLRAEPNRAGANDLTVRVTPMGATSPEVLRVIFHFTYQGQNVGTVSENATEAGPSLYRLTGSQLSLAGPWQIDVAVRRKGVEDSVAHFNWIVPPAGALRRPVPLPGRPWETPLTTAAAGLAVTCAVLATGLALRHRATARGAGLGTPDERVPR